MNNLPTPQRGQVWRSKLTGFTYEVLDDSPIDGGWAAKTQSGTTRPFFSVPHLHNGDYEPPRAEIKTYWVNVYDDGSQGGIHTSAHNADQNRHRGHRVCRVPLTPDWDAAVYDEGSS